MTNAFTKHTRKTYNAVIGSIAFYPGIIAIGFLIFSVLMLEIDFSEFGKGVKGRLSWISLRDASTARSIISTIVGGIISLTVFSFSMVMIVLNQAASQMSNRMLTSMIGNRFQQVVLGIYIGTIVYALFLLSTIRDISSGIYVPALSIYLLILITVGDIFLFIYFLHYVTQSVKFETIIDRVHRQTRKACGELYTEKNVREQIEKNTGGQEIPAPESGYMQEINDKELVAFAVKHKGFLQVRYPVGSFLLCNETVAIFYGAKRLDTEDINQLMTAIDFYSGQPIHKNPYYGFHQLAEVALKALSPGINDPQTAVLSMSVLADLFFYRMKHSPASVFYDDDGISRLQQPVYSFADLFARCYYPIWDYGKNDRYIQDAMLHICTQLQNADSEGRYTDSIAPLMQDVLQTFEKRGL